MVDHGRRPRHGHRPRPGSAHGRPLGGRHRPQRGQVTQALGEHENLLAVSLDITDPAAAQAAVDASVARFGRIDTLVNNAGTFQAAYFEEISDQAHRAQMDTNFFGPLNVTRAVLPIMRKQRSGHVITFSSTAGLVGVDFCSAYSASKFALEGWMETLQLDVEPFGITTTIVEPGYFRTELLVDGASTVWADLSIDDYAERTKKTIARWKSMNGQQGGDPAKLATSLVTIAGLEDKPLRWMVGADSVANAKGKAHDLLAQADAHLDLSVNLDHYRRPVAQAHRQLRQCSRPRGASRSGTASVSHTKEKCDRS